LFYDSFLKGTYDEYFKQLAYKAWELLKTHSWNSGFLVRIDEISV